MNFTPYKKFWHHSLRRQMVLSFSLAALLITLISGVLFYSSQRDFLYRESTERAQSLAQTLALSSSTKVLAEDLASLDDVLESVASMRDLRRVEVWSAQGVVMASNQPRAAGALPVAVAGTAGASPQLTEDEQHVEVIVPIWAAQTVLGWIRVEFSRDMENAHLRALGWEILLVGGILLLLIVAIATLLARSMTVGLTRLVQVATLAEQGEVFPRDDQHRIDEIGVLARHLYLVLDTLRQASEKNLLLLRHASDGIHILNSHGDVVEASDSFCTMLGYRRDEIIGMNVTQWDALFSPQQLAPLIAQQIETQAISQFETLHRRKDGSVFDVEVSGAPLEISGMQLLFNSSRDISQRKQAERALLASETVLRQAQQIAGLGSYVFHVEAGIWQSSPLLDELFGIGAAYVRDVKGWLALIHSDDRSIMLRYLSDEVLGAKHAFDKEYRIVRHADQAVRWVHGMGKLELDAAGQPLRLVGVIQDVTERKQLELEISIAAKAFASNEGMLVTDAQGCILKVNAAFTAITGYSEQEVLGKNPKLLSSGMHDAKFYAAMWARIRRTDTWEGEIFNRRKNGNIYPEHLTINAVRDAQGNLTHYVGVITDITDNHQTQQRLRSTADELAIANQKVEQERALLALRVEERTAQLQYANHAKDSFLATMSHEIRTPLGGLLGMMELLELSNLDASQREMVHAARSSGKSLLRIVNDILDWSKIEAGKLAVAPQPACLRETLQGVVNTYAQLTADTNIQLKFSIDAELTRHHYLFDPLRLSQVLNNFTSNALKFTERGSVQIRAQRLSGDQRSERVCFSVKDTGIGISPTHQARLFQQYEQGSADTARMYGGTGLGLAICRRLAELMGGELAVDSQLGVGSTFSLTLDLPVANDLPCDAAAALPLVAELSARRVEEPAVLSGRHILIVDDHPINRMMLKQQLELLGVQVEVAADGKEAMTCWQRSQFDMLITDCHMPEMDGYQLTYLIREQEQQAATARVPVIAWTANVLAEEAEHCRAAGMDDILTKPTELAELRAKLEHWLVERGGESVR